MKNAICYSFSFLVEAIILWQYTSRLFLPKRSSKENLLVLSLLYLFLFGASLFEKPSLNAVFFLIVNFIFLITQCQIKWYLALFHSAILTAIMSTCELLLYGMISHFTPQFFSKSAYFYNLLTLTIFSKILYFTILTLMIHIFEGRKKYSQEYDWTTLLLGVIPITSIFIILTLLRICEAAGASFSSDWMVSLSSVLLLSINLLVFGIHQYNQKKNRKFTEMLLLLQRESDNAEYYEMLHQQNENQSILIHDIKKHLQSINLLIAQKEYDKVTAYIQQLMLSSDLKEASRLCDHEILNAILYRYKRQCDCQNITFHTDIRSGTTTFLSDHDLTSLFCNLLDNALEAADGISEAFIELNVGKRENSPLVVITAVNSCQEDPFSNGRNLPVTNKADKSKHGFGLKSIQKVVEKYHGNMQMYYHGETATFHTIITLKY